MKNGLALMLSIFMTVSLAACGAEPSRSGETVEDSSQTVTEEETIDTEPAEGSVGESNSNILIAYFSRWGNT